MDPGRSRARAFAWIAAAVALAAAGAWWFAAAMRARTGGAWCAPVDDAFIYLQYARRIAEGHGFAYTDGNAPSSGASSLLYTLLLVPAWWLGARGESFFVVGVAIGTLALAATALLAARLAGDLAPDGRRAFARMLAAALVALCGPLLWAAYSGMDTLVFAAALVGALALLVRRGPEPGPAWLAFGALACARPEGTVFGLAALAVLALHAGRAGLSALSGRASVRWGIASLAVLAIPTALNVALTGSPVGDSTRVKSVALYLPPDAPPAVQLSALVGLVPQFAGNALEIALAYGSDFRRWSPDRMEAWAVTVIVGAGLASGMWRAIAGRHGAAGRILALWIVCAVAFPSTSPLWNQQGGRYLSPYAPLVAVATAAGWAAMLRGAAARAVLPAAFAVLPVVVAALLARGVVHARESFASECEKMAHIQMRTGLWIAAHAAPHERVAIDDAGLIAFFGERPTLDLIGLTTPGWATTALDGKAALFEQLRALPDAKRPALLAALPAWAASIAPPRFAGEPLLRAESEQTTPALRLEKNVWRLVWSALALGARPESAAAREAVDGLELADAVNVADRASERAHGYAARVSNPSIVRDLPCGAPGGPLVIDGGRAVSKESMRVRARPGRDAVLVVRAFAPNGAEADVALDGAAVGRLRFAAAPDAWSEACLRIAADRVRGDAPTLELRVAGADLPVFHHWLYQSGR